MASRSRRVKLNQNLRFDFSLSASAQRDNNEIKCQFTAHRNEL